MKLVLPSLVLLVARAACAEAALTPLAKPLECSRDGLAIAAAIGTDAASEAAHAEEAKARMLAAVGSTDAIRSEVRAFLGELRARVRSMSQRQLLSELSGYISGENAKRGYLGGLTRQDTPRTVTEMILDLNRGPASKGQLDIARRTLHGIAQGYFELIEEGPGRSLRTISSAVSQAYPAALLDELRDRLLADRWPIRVSLAGKDALSRMPPGVFARHR